MKRGWVADYWAALEDCEKAIQMQPSLARAHCRRVAALISLGQLQVNPPPPHPAWRDAWLTLAPPKRRGGWGGGVPPPPQTGGGGGGGGGGVGGGCQENSPSRFEGETCGRRFRLLC